MDPATVRTVPVIAPPALEQIEVAQSSLDFLRMLKREGKDGGKVVLGIFAGRAVLALGPTRRLHLHIVDCATDELHFPRRIVTSLSPDQAKPIPGALIQGAHFAVTNWDLPKVCIHSYSESFGGFRGLLFGRPIEEVVNDLLRAAVKRSVEKDALPDAEQQTKPRRGRDPS